MSIFRETAIAGAWRAKIQSRCLRNRRVPIVS